MEENTNHNITIQDRKNITISGIKKIENFDKEEFLLETSMGYLLITGKELELIKLDTNIGNISIRGMINSFNYTESKKKQKEESLFTKLFKWFYLYK